MKTTEQLFQENENLIKKIANNIAIRTGIEFQDLYSEALLALVEKKDYYNKSKSKFTTFLYTILTNHLLNYSEYLYRTNPSTTQFEVDSTEFIISSNKEFIPKTKDAEHIKNIIINNYSEYMYMAAPSVLEDVKIKLKKNKWDNKKIKKGIKELKHSLFL